MREERQNKDFYSALIKYMSDEGRPMAKILKEVLEDVEKRAKIVV